MGYKTNALCFSFGDVDGNYAVDTDDFDLLEDMRDDVEPYNILGDLNLDGDITQADVNLYTYYEGRDGRANVLSVDEEANDIGYAGYIWNDESGNYHVRNRELSPQLGRWLQRDPIKYRGRSYNLYQYADSYPIAFTDPIGFIAFGPGDEQPSRTPKQKQPDLTRSPYHDCMRECDIGCVNERRRKEDEAEEWKKNNPESPFPEYPNLREYQWRHQDYRRCYGACLRKCATSRERVQNQKMGLGGFEPPTSPLSAVRSDQLSYEPFILRRPPG